MSIYLFINLLIYQSMFYLRLVKNDGTQYNMPIGETYTRINVLDIKFRNSRVYKHFDAIFDAAENDKDTTVYLLNNLPSSSVLIVPGVGDDYEWDKLISPLDINHWIKKCYIVTESGKTYESFTCNAISISPDSFDADADWWEEYEQKLVGDWMTILGDCK